MAKKDREQAIGLSMRICFIILAAVCLLGAASYRLLSRNFHTHLTDYTISLVRAMVEQGVITVEYELKSGRGEAAIMASSFSVPAPGERIVFPQQESGETEALRILYISETGTVSSDGRQRDVRGRGDIDAAFGGENAVYGPYYNEEDEFVICYSAPVKRDGRIVGVLSMEKDGYRFCELIEDIKFAKSGECYIINSEGTDIAVSDPQHMDWVTEEYNARELLKIQEDLDARTVMELEQRGLNGESGVGTYQWQGSLCYVLYAPIPSVGWVLLAGMREEEISSITQSTIAASIFKGSIPVISLFVFLVLTALILYWLLSSMRKNAELNKALKSMANHDELTGLLNRRFLETKVAERWNYPLKKSSQAAVFMIDIDNFKDYNDLFGHPQGDVCLKRIAEALRETFEDCEGDVIRYGGEEFAAVAFCVDRETAEKLGTTICRRMVRENISDGKGGYVTVSAGLCHVADRSKILLKTCIEQADCALYQAKHNGKNRMEIFEN